MLDIIITVIETLGTVAFALSGVLTAIERRLDLFGAVVLAGTTIETGSVIGANATVTKDVPENSVAVGNPARVIKKR